MLCLAHESPLLWKTTVDDFHMLCSTERCHASDHIFWVCLDVLLLACEFMQVSVLNIDMPVYVLTFLLVGLLLDVNLSRGFTYICSFL